MRDRLIELVTTDIECTKDGHGDCSMCEYRYADDKCAKYYSEIIADFLLANGVIVLPCKVGDKVYHLASIDTLDELNVVEIFEGKVCSISKEEKTLWFFCRYDNGLNFWYTERDIGKKVFFTKEEAEQALRKEDERK